MSLACPTPPCFHTNQLIWSSECTLQLLPLWRYPHVTYNLFECTIHEAYLNAKEPRISWPRKPYKKRVQQQYHFPKIGMFSGRMKNILLIFLSFSLATKYILYCKVGKWGVHIFTLFFSAVKFKMKFKFWYTFVSCENLCLKSEFVAHNWYF